MKILTAAFLSLSMASAEAAFISLHCSNATGTVIWEEGNTKNIARLTYDGFVTGAIEVEREHLEITLQEEVTLRDQLLSQCGVNSTLTTFAARTQIVPAEGHPDVLQSYFPDNKIEADVICERITSTEANCRP